MPENPEMGGMCPHGNNPDECEACQAEQQLEEEKTQE